MRLNPTYYASQNPFPSGPAAHGSRILRTWSGRGPRNRRHDHPSTSRVYTGHLPHCPDKCTRDRWTLRTDYQRPNSCISSPRHGPNSV